MLTKDVVNAIAEKTGGTKKDAKAHLDAFQEVVKEAIVAGTPVDLKGFAQFDTVEVAARSAKNPQDGSAVEVAAHRKGTVKLAKSLRKFN